MNLDELRSVQSKERSKDSLQHLRESFYSDVADYVADLRERRDRRAEQAEDPFADPEVSRLTDEIQTAEEVVEGIYERRVGKVVKRASLAAMGVAADSEGLTSEEERLFEELVESIEENKQDVLDVLAGEETAPPTDATPGTDSAAADVTPATESAPTPGDAPGEPPTPSESGETAPSDVSAADVMGGESGPAAATPSAESGATTDEEDAASRPNTEAAAVAGGGASAGGDASADEAASASAGGDAGASAGEEASADAPEAESAGDADADPASDDGTDLLGGLDERTTVRVTDDVGEIFGVDERTYDLASEDVVTLPEANAEPLVERGAAEKLE